MYFVDVRIVTRRAFFVGVLLIGLVVAIPSSVFAQSVTLAWNPVTNAAIAGYNIYYGPASQTYTNVTSVGNVTNATISGLAQGATYYFAATSLSTSGLESAYSTELSYTVPNAVPILQVTPGSIAYGTILNGTSATNSFVVKNAGTGTLVGTASVGAPFSVVSGGSYSLGANGSQNVVVAFSPGGATNYSQSVTFTGGSGTNTTVSGSATNAPVPAPVLQVTPGSIAYGTILNGTSATNSFVVKNAGTGTLVGTASVGAPFSVVSGGSYSLGANGSQSVVVAFSPGAATNYSQSVTFTGGSGTNTTVSGSATNAPVPAPVLQVTPGSIAYGTILNGTSATNSFVVKNAGTGTLVGTASVGAPFSVVSGGSYSLGANGSQSVVVAFSPGAATNYSQSVTFTGGSGTNTTVSGSATNAPVPAPVLQVTPGSIAYGTILNGTSATNSFVVKNAGTGTLVGTASVGAPFSVVSGGSYSLGANGSQNVVVAFSPGGATNYSQSVTFTGGSGTNTTVSGSATNAPVPAPVLQVTPGSIAYGTILNGTSATNSFVVKNAGTGTLVGTASVGAPFSVVSGGSYSLGANGSQSVVVAFSPGAATNYSQSVTFTGGSGTNTTVSGSATNAPVPAPVLQVTPGSIAYGTILNGTSATNSFVVKNAGTGTLVGTASVGAPFSVVSGGSYSLGANGSQSVVVAFSPGAATNYSQSVTFTGGSGTNTTVSGSATNAPVPAPVLQVTPGSIAYGTILNGTSATNSFVVKNAGTGTLVGTASVGAPFSVVSGGSYSLGANGSQNVVVAFSPGGATNYSQSVTFTGGSGTNTTVSGSATNAPVPAPVLQVTPGSIAYGTILNGTSATNSFVVKNAGTGTLVGTASVGAPFSVVSGGSYSLGANGSQSVVVAFSPGAATNYSQSVTFTGGSGTNTTVSGSATNAPVPAPVLQVTPGSIAYGTILNGTSATNSFVVKNAGTGTLVGTASVGAPFSVVSGGSYSLGANGSQSVVVAFSPGAATNYSQSVTFTGGSGTNTTVSGSATNAPVPAPVLQVTPGSIAYGTILNGTSATNSFVVKNAGTGTLVGTASVGAPFSVVSGGSYSLGANGSQNVVVAFSPGGATNYSQSVTFTGGSGTNTTVSGSATNKPPVLPTVSAISVNATDVDSSTPGLQVYVGTTVQFSATATNAQTWQWSYTVNGGAPVVYTNSTSPITNISYYYDASTANNSYVWTLVVSNGQAWAESQTKLAVENVTQGQTFAATSGTLNGLLTANTVIDGVSSSYIYQPLPSIGDVSGGTAAYNFTIANAGNYEIEALVDAPTTDANSFYVNIDSVPQDSSMIWDIMPVTSGFEQRIVSWRGGGSENNDQIVPKVFSLSAGPHQIIFVGREPGTALASFTLLQVASTTQAVSQSMQTASVQSQATKNLINDDAQASIASAPLITSTPTNYVAVAGQTVTLNAAGMNVSSSLALVYQWQFNSVNLSMANNATLTLNNVTTNQSGTYTLAVSDAGETTISGPVILTIYPTSAATLAAVAHTAGQFSLSVSGVPGYRYDVQASTNLVDWVPLQTNTSPFLFIDSDAGKFKQRFYRSLYVQ